LILTIIKLVAAYFSKSVGVFSEGIHSSLDLVSAFIAFFTIREAAKPADQEHPYGHGKIETLSSLAESLLLLAAAVFIAYEAYTRFQNPSPLENNSFAIIAILISLIISWVVYRHNRLAADFTESTAIRVNALHFFADAITALGVLIALILIQWTGWLWMDPLIAAVISIYIFLASIQQIRMTIHELTDVKLPDSELVEIKKALEGFKSKILNVHDIRTRKSGVERHIEFHLTVCAKMNVEESHTICDEMETSIKNQIPHPVVTIHVEPCGHHGKIKAACERSPSGICEKEREL
jgi:cation diffusion facilitator family transporter